MKRIQTEMLFKLSNLNSNLPLTLGYFNPALNNSALNSNCGIVWIFLELSNAHTSYPFEFFH